MKFDKIVKELTLILRQITHARSRTCSSLEISLLILFRRLRKTDTWEDASKTVRRSRCVCADFHNTMFYSLKENMSVVLGFYLFVV